ncbi:MAG: molybdopterin-dependent oxidoreductase, partial [Acidimicrobiales bacterium]
VLLLAPDLKEELPVLFLRLRHAVTRDGASVVELAAQRTSSSELAQVTLLHRPGAVGEVVSALLAGSASQEVGGIEPSAIAQVAALLADGPVTVVLGRANLAESSDAPVAAAAAIHAAHPEVRFLSALRRGNVHGALDMGLAPGLLPGRTTLDDGRTWFRESGWPTVPSERGLDATGILQEAAAGRLDVLVLLGADPLADFPDRDLATRALAGARTVIAVDRFLTASSQQADVVLAAAGPTEVDGTTTNIEGRISTVSRKVTPPGTARDDWMVAAELSRLLGVDLGLTSPTQILDEIATLAPSHAGITPEIVQAHGGRDGVVAPLAPEERPELESASPSDPGVDPAAGEAAVAAAAVNTDEEQRAADAEATEAQADAEGEADHTDAEPPGATATAPPPPAGPTRPGVLAFTAPAFADAPPVDAYSLRLVAVRKLYDQGTDVQHAPGLAGLAAESSLRMHPHDFDRLGVDAGAMVTVSTSSGSVTLPVRPDLAVGKGAAAVVVGQTGPAIGSLIDAVAAVTEVRVAKS